VSVRIPRVVRRTTVVALGLGALVGAAIPTSSAGAAYGPPGAPSPNPAFAVPLAGAQTTTATTWATVVMGKNDGDFDLFWQLFALNPASSTFRLVTPPGVADNGGLIVAADPAGKTALVGFGTSQGLQFSPLALTTSQGSAWAPGGLTHALVAAPSTVAIANDAPTGALAVVGGSSQAVLESSGSLTSWKTLVTKQTLSATPAGQSCDIGSLQAVTIAAGATPVAGVSCRRPDTPGVLIDSDRQWHLADIPVPNALARDAFATLRLSPTSALLAGVHGATTNLVEAWSIANNRPWDLSPAISLKSASDLVASGSGPGTEQFVLLRTDGSDRAEVISGPGGSWRMLPALPRSTATIAIAPSGAVFALAVSVTRLTVYRLGTTWNPTQHLTVPIVFGSSS
jgi:hypothetical protein